ncbi:hypothetical protein P5G65_04550 [Paenibacillus chondroitinus]|uniref:Uncharacterized protein n=1 Tax=Paenibacillus chondroitinus TaxID=59842 RepID=A0ABU6D603_9BACL|nr:MULTISPECIES: hypothetical protein [Paenibacillus]MCY9658182.1 hypothetical protein [Paenibacillus anseongense]MEB4793155.1 hypothetical protein [Paenibacillus chondroitinus]
MNQIIQNMDFSKGWWYPAILGVFLLLFIVFMPKRLNMSEIYLTFGVIAGLVWVIDTIFSVWLDLFDVGSPNKRGIPEFFMYTIIPPSFAVIYLNVYQEYKKLLYTILFTAVSELAEWLAVAVGIMTLKHWNPLYSIPVYLVVYYFYLPFHLRVMKRTSKSEH